MFNLESDPLETSDLRLSQPILFQTLMERLLEIGRSTYQTNHSGGADTCDPAPEALQREGGFLSPRCRK